MKEHVVKKALKPELGEYTSSSTGFLVNQLARLMTQVLGQAMRPHGIAPAHFPILLLLWERDGQSQSELRTVVKVEQATIALTLDRMERDELIVRRPNPLDNRSRLIFLSAKGRALKGPALAIGREVNAKALADLSPASQKQFIKRLKSAIENCRVALSDGSDSGS